MHESHQSLQFRAWQFWIDVGGTFTDCLGLAPDGRLHSHKLLSTGVYRGRVGARSSATRVQLGAQRGLPPNFYRGYRFSLARLGDGNEAEVRAFYPETGEVELDRPLPRVPAPGEIYELASGLPAPVAGMRWLMRLGPDTPVGLVSVRLGTTRGTNALLTRQGARVALVTTAGFADVLAIGYQNRPRLFALEIRKPKPIYEEVIEATERLDAQGQVLRSLDLERLGEDLRALRRRGTQALAIVFMHAHKNPSHEQAAAAVARRLGFTQISLSSAVAPLQRIVPRGDTTVVDAYLSPVIASYVAELRRALPEADLQLMTSSGGLVPAAAFQGRDSVLSGPAGGVVAVANVAREAGIAAAIGFDMGGTSTDVCRFGGDFERRYEMELSDPERDGGVRIVAPMLAIETVAAGGGSCCAFDGNKLTVGPQSAGADPGPACYGRGGPLTITDCNLLLGRIVPEHFNLPLDTWAARQRLLEVCAQVNAANLGGAVYTPEQVAVGFLRVAVSTMVQPIKKLSLARGYDVREHALVSFGGAGAQHACQIAEELGITRIVQHPYASFLSAFGIGTADIRRFAVRDIGCILSAPVSPGDQDVNDVNDASDVRAATALQATLDAMVEELRAECAAFGASAGPPRFSRSLDLRFLGQDSVITIGEPDDGNWERAFVAAHIKQYGFALQDRRIEVRAARVEACLPLPKHAPPLQPERPHRPVPRHHAQAYFRGTAVETPVFADGELEPGAVVAGPALITTPATVTVVEVGWEARLTGRQHLELTQIAAQPQPLGLDAAWDPVQLALFEQQFTSIAEQMGLMLQRTSLSVNVKERLDFSCAIFAPDGGLVVNAPHIPVHLGAMSDSVRSVLKEHGAAMQMGDSYVTNDPYQGGSHLPDVTVITPVFAADGRLIFLVGNRAHHAEIGGSTPGSMPPNARCLAEEGVLIRCLRLGPRDSGEEQLRRLLAAGPFPSRSPANNIADIHAQLAANELGRQQLLALAERSSIPILQAFMGHVRASAARQMRVALSRLPPGSHSFADAMDDGTRVAVTVTITGGAVAGGPRVICDFSGTGPVAAGNLNANPAIVKAATLYVFRCLIGSDVALNDGVLEPVTLIIPSPSLLSPPAGDDPAKLPAVTAGNVETSQRLVDVLLGALGIAAASQGTMNNFLFGRAACPDVPGFGYYETICGGAGAGPTYDGAAAVHTHMTNTRITDPEVLEDRFPVRLRRFSIRRGSGGAGAHRGGDGVCREVEFLMPLTVSLITSRRLTAPFGLAGGGAGAPGRNILQRGSGGPESLPPMAQVQVEAGDVLIIETPGGGGYGQA